MSGCLILTQRECKERQKKKKQDLLFIGKYVNTVEYRIVKNGSNINENQQQRQKDLQFSGTLPTKRIETQRIIDKIY